MLLLVIGAIGVTSRGDSRIAFRRGVVARELDVIDSALRRSWRGDARVIAGPAFTTLSPRAANSTTSEERRDPRLTMSVALLEQRGARTDDPELWNGLGAGYLLQRRFGEAIAAFERAMARAPDTLALTNLSAAYMMRGEPADRIKALDAALKATGTGLAPAEAWFNAALVSEALLPPEDAIAAWKRALRHESSNAWRNVIERRMAAAALRGNSPEGSGPETLRHRLDRDVLPRWARACVASQREDMRDLARDARDLTEALARHTTDRYPAALIEWLGSGECDRDRASAYLEFVAALEMYEQDRRDAAMAALEALVPRLQPSRSPALIPARVHLAICHYFMPAAALALPMLDAAAADARARDYHDVLGRTEWARGYIAEDHSAFDRARTSYHAAIAAYGKAANADGTRAVASLDATLSDTLGNYRDGWAAREASLGGMRPGADRRALHGMLRGATRAAVRDGRPHAALAFATVRMGAARASDAPIRIVEAAIDQARVEYQLGLRDRARKTLEEAIAARARIDSEGARTRNDADLALAQAQVADDPALSRARLTEALASYELVGSNLLRGRLLLHRARAAITVGDAAAAERDLLAGIDAFEGVRRQLSAAPARLSYFEEAWQLFDELLTLRVRQHRMIPALDALERGRGSVLRETTDARMSPQELARALPPHATVLAYAVLERELIIWILGKGQIRAVRRPIGRDALQALVARVRDDAGTNAESPAARLYDLLIAPVESDLPPDGRLYVVPDPLLHYVPFAALWRAASHQYLIERHSVILVPSIAVAQVGRMDAGEARDDAALVVAAPDGGASEKLPRLPAVAREGREIAALYPHGRLLTGAELHKAAVMASARDFSLLHFAGHAIVHPDNPQLSRLLLTSDAEHGRLYAHDLDTLDLRHVSTVVLAACSTAAGRTYRSEGVVSLARTFMGRGVRRVVATLWEIEDAEAGRLFRAIHEGIRKGTPVGDAVADVQRQAIRAGRTASDWRTLIVISRIVR